MATVGIKGFIASVQLRPWKASNLLVDVVDGVGTGADRVGLDDDERVGRPLEHVEEWSVHRRRDWWHGGDLDDALQETPENVTWTQSQFRHPLTSDQ